MTEPTDNMNEEHGYPRKYILLIAIMGILILFLSIISIYLWRENIQIKEQLSKKQQEFNEVEVMRQNLLSELTALKEGYSQLQTENADLKKEIEAKKKQIDSLIALVKKGKIAMEELKKARNEIETLKKIMRHYVQVIDSLNQINQKLMAENVQYKEKHKEASQKIQQLQEVKTQLEEKVKIGERLKALKIEAIPGFMRKGIKFVDSKRHKKVTTIKICLNIDENPLTPPGKYKLYGRVIAPDGTVLVDKEDAEHTFEFMGSHGYFSFLREFDYSGIAINDYCIYYEPPVKLIEGKYIVELYIQDYLLGKTEFELK